MPQRGAKRPPSFGGITTLGDRFFNMRFELLVDLSIQTFAAKNICHPRPERHIKPPAARDSQPESPPASATLRRQVASCPPRSIHTCAPASRNLSLSIQRE